MQESTLSVKPTPGLNKSPQLVYADLLQLRVGIVDTSTLIYLERLKLLSLISKHLQLYLIPAVVAEFGQRPKGMPLIAARHGSTTDSILLETAIELALPLLSEDGGLLRKARKREHPHYNTLMLLLTLRAQNVLSAQRCAALQTRLLTFARYSEDVCNYATGLLTFIEEQQR
nr:hypothetical protein [uncultured Desulfobulbus sp.]